MRQPCRVLILGASYGSLFAHKLLLAGHSVVLVALPATVSRICQQGTRLLFPVRNRSGVLEVPSRQLPGALAAKSPCDVDPGHFDLVVLAMQEPQYRAPELRTLLADISLAEIPCLSIMNMPPLPYLARLPDIDADACRACFTDASVWDLFDPALVTHCSADPQVSRVPDEPENVLQVRLPSNFKVARFDSDSHTAMLYALAADIEAARFDTGDARVELPVKLKVHDSVFAPLAKWPMLIAGNYRCLTRDGARSIRSAVHTSLSESRMIYQWMAQLCRSLGVEDTDLVSFDRYSAAALSLEAPSSVARALVARAAHVERVDRLVQSIATQRGFRLGHLDEIVALVDSWLATSRRVRPNAFEDLTVLDAPEARRA